MPARCPSCSYENPERAAFCGMCKTPFRKAGSVRPPSGAADAAAVPGRTAVGARIGPASSVPRTPASSSSAALALLGRAAGLLRTHGPPLVGLWWSGMPPGPRPPGEPIYVWVPIGTVRLPDRCPACAGPADTEYELEYAEEVYLIFWTVTTRVQLPARFCRRCVKAIALRRWYVFGRAALAFLAGLAAVAFLGNWGYDRYRDDWGARVGFSRTAEMVVMLVVLFEAVRWLWKAYKRRWNVGLRIAAIEGGEPGRYCLEMDDPDYALELRALNGLAPPAAAGATKAG